MYIPKHFEITEKDEIAAFIKANAFGQLISLVDARLFCTHIPFLMSDSGQSLLCHLAKGNPQWQNIEEQEVLITFQGPHDYISPSWYQSPGVPTWNYQAVHVYGKASLITENEKLKGIVKRLTKIYESSFEQAWTPEYADILLNAIVGIEIEIGDIQCKYKLSQNRADSDRKQISDELQQKGSAALSRAMKNAN